VRVNAIAPGTIDTEQNRHAAEDPDSARYVTREQVAEVALFLISPAASGVSGETIFVLGDTLG
jgi:3-oxoacyl-[acyl-carrier protein] reductase